MVYSAVKRTVDVVVAGLLLVLLLPVLAVAAGLILLEDGPPVLYRQSRAGRGGAPFRLLKLRSMRVNELPVSVVGQVRGGHGMVTRVGRVLRRLKLDETPQLVNVLRGEMSVVGPRPTVPEQVAAYDEFQRRRLRVRPGMTGWAQVNGNVELSWDERILLDVWYVDHPSLLLDLKILLRTAWVVAAGERRDTRALEIARAYADGPGRRGR